ncbi:MCE family protein [Nocardioides sp. YIM 152315]|uniref:MCE family protein n=1 Tax=Nocardioides sp. YIM 152315 TaxID=3031760 RepID=UPI0023DC1455|nr:MCE family protein [Nocardioides sp. YIM 152315]MDF1606026.1 MCE family protein [Nocardioides sp. YIM 152315]
MSSPATILRTLAGVLAGALLLTGCDFDVYELPLPGGADVGDDAITVTADFRDVLDLVPKSTVKVNDVSVGKVTDIDLEGDHAVVTMQLPRDTDLPANAIAEIRQTSLLGEKFVSLAPPTGEEAEGSLGDGAEIPLEQTGRNPEVEEVLGALSLVLNGGGVAQLKTIATEINHALDGREGAARSVLGQIRQFMSQLDENKDDIVTAIDSVNHLAKEVREQEGSIDAALEELPSALTSLDKQRGDLVKMLRALDDLSSVGVQVIRASKEGTIDALEQLTPVVEELANSGDAFVKSFNVFLTYPFVDEVVGRDPQVARNLHMGDYTNLSIELDVDLSGGITGVPTQLPTLLPGDLEPTRLVPLLTQCLTSGALTSASCQQLMSTVQGLNRLKSACLEPENANVVLCTALKQLPGLPHLPGTENLPSVPVLGDLLGLGRAPAGPTARATKRGPTMGQLSKAFDPALVRLLVPGMVSAR